MKGFGRVRGIVVAGAVAATACVSAASVPAGQTVPPAVSAYHLVAVSDRDGDDDVYAVGPRGGRLAALTRNRVDDSFVVVAPSGDFFVFRGSKAFIVSADGRRERKLGNAYFEAVLSGDGRVLAFASEDRTGERDRVSVVPVAGGPVRDLGPGLPDALSRNGRYVGAVVDGAPYHIDARTRRRTAVPEPHRADDQHWMWSPNAARIAYVIERENEPGDELVVAGARPRGAPRVVARGEFEATWLDDRRLGVTRFDELSVIDVVSGTERRVAHLEGAETFGSAGWSPRGDAVAYVVSGDTPAVVVKHLSGREIRVEVGSEPGALIWSPRGDQIALGGAGDLSVLKLTPSLRVLRVAARDTYGVVWSPDERALAVPTEAGFSIFSVAVGTERVFVPLGGWSQRTLAWARGPLPRAAPTAARPPELDTRTKRLTRRLPRSGTLVSLKGEVDAFAQDGDRLAWVRDSPGPFPTFVEVLDVRRATRTAIGGIRRRSGETNPGLYPVAFAFGRDRALLIDVSGGTCGLSACYFGVRTASLGDRQLRAIDSMQYEHDADAFPNPDELPVLAEADGRSIVYYSRCYSTDECGGGGSVVRRLDGRRPVTLTDVEYPTALAVSANRFALAERTDRPSRDVPSDERPSTVPTSRVTVRDVSTGAGVMHFDVDGSISSVALTASRLAAFVVVDRRTRIEVRDAASGVLLRSVPVAGGSSLSMSGDRVVFRDGRTIRVLSASTGRVSVVARAASTPIGLSIEGKRVAWAERTRGRSRIRAQTLR